MRRDLFVVSLLASMAWSAVAVADEAADKSDGDVKKRAAAIFAEAQAAFARRDFAAAARRFEEAGELVPHPATFLNAAEAWEKAHELARAAEACDAALAPIEGAGGKVDARFRETANARLAALLPRIATLEVTGAQRVRVRVDGGSAFLPPRKFRLSPGRHVLVITDASTGRAVEREVDLTAGETRELEATLPAERPVPPAKEAPHAAARAPRGGPPTLTWICFGATGLALGAGGFLGVRTVNAKEAYDAQPTYEAHDEFYAYRTATNVALGTAAVAAAVGIVAWIVRPSGR